jgi:hypothetical protein
MSSILYISTINIYSSTCILGHPRCIYGWNFLKQIFFVDLLKIRYFKNILNEKYFISEKKNKYKKISGRGHVHVYYPSHAPIACDEN